MNLKYLRSLKLKKYRQRERKFLVEGENLLRTALDNGFLPQQVFIRRDFADRALIESIETRGIDSIFISESQMGKISNVKTPPGIVALMPFFEYDHGFLKKASRLLFLDNIADPGNTGTLIRTACALDFDGVLLSPDSCEIYNPKVLRSSAGYIFRIKILDNFDPGNLDGIKTLGFSLISADPEAEISIGDRRCPEKAVIVLGNEPRGIKPGILRSSDLRIKIPMADHVDSLNVASAGAIIMYWASA
jgi:TrmH family RNA methyltransferase